MRLFQRIPDGWRRHIFQDVEPYKMDRETLLAFKERAMDIHSPSYKAPLREMKQEVDYQVFWDMIQGMLDFGIQLEQEQIIV